METQIKLTKLASCAGCGAKVGAGTLAAMLEGFRTHTDPRLIVGYGKSDDACVYRLTDYPEINPEMAKPLLLMRGENGPVYQWGKAPLL